MTPPRHPHAVDAANSPEHEPPLGGAGSTHPAMGGPAEPNVLATIWRHKFVVVVFVAAFAAIGVLASTMRDPQYVAESGVLLADPRPSASRAARDEVRYVADQVAILKSVPVAERASVIVAGGPTAEPLVQPGELRRKTTITASAESNFISIKVKSITPEAAVASANAIVQAYRELVRTEIEAAEKATIRKLNLEIARIAKTIPAAALAKPTEKTKPVIALLNKLRAERARLQVDAALTTDVVSLFYPAKRGKPEKVSLSSALVISVLLGGLVGSGVAYLLGMRRRPPRNRFAPTVLEPRPGRPPERHPVQPTTAAATATAATGATPATPAEVPGQGAADAAGRPWRSERQPTTRKAAVRRVKGP